MIRFAVPGPGRRHAATELESIAAVAYASKWGGDPASAEKTLGGDLLEILKLLAHAVVWRFSMKVASATIRMKRTEDGGKRLAIGNGGDFSCPAFFPEIGKLSAHGYDCRLLLGRDGRSIAPGETAENVPIAFVSPDQVFAHITIGTRFELWESGVVGEGEITALPER